MTARLITVADAIVTELDTFLDTISVTETPARSWKTNYDLETLETLHVDVVAATLEAELDDRGGHVANTYGINVAVQKKVDPLSDTFTADFDALVNIIDAIHGHYPQESTISGIATAVCVGRELVVFSPEFLASKSQFFGVVTFLFREVV